MLKIENLHASLEDGKEILKGTTLTLGAGEVHALMGPNGAGKSTLGNVLAGRPGYEVTEGTVTLNGQNVLEMTPDERARAGIYLAFQYPTELPGVNVATFARAALNTHRKARGEEEMNAVMFLKTIRTHMAALGMKDDVLQRDVNAGFSGGEKKRFDILLMTLLEPTVCILDETDSGLDVDALKAVAEGVNRLRNPNRTFLIITHYQRLLNLITPDVVHIFENGKIIKTGGPELAEHLEAQGYEGILAQ